MLYGQIIKETRTEITFRVASDRGDAKQFGLVGEFRLDTSRCHIVQRRDLKAARPRPLDELVADASLLDELARRSPSPVD